jgi:hypothetical protein
MASQSQAPSKAEIISIKARRDLQEYFVTTTLRTISNAFDDAGINCDSSFVSTDSGQRRILVQQYYASLDFTNWDDVRKFLMVYAEALAELQRQAEGMYAEEAKKNLLRLTRSILREGFEFRDGRLVPAGSLSTAATLKEEAIRVDAPYLIQQVDRIETQIDNDPRLAIGTSKELVETVCKTILSDLNVEFDRKWELSDLMKRTREELKLVPDDVPDAAKASDTIRRLLGSLGNITQSLAELRNASGTGHGHDGRANGLSPRHARLAAGAACTLAKFLFDTHQHRNDSA